VQQKSARLRYGYWLGRRIRVFFQRERNYGLLHRRQRIWAVALLVCLLCKQAVGGRPSQYAPASHLTLTFDLLTLKVVSKSRVTWATFVLILVFLGLSGLDLGPMYATDRQTDVKQHHRLMPPRRGIIKFCLSACTMRVYVSTVSYGAAAPQRNSQWMESKFHLLSHCVP